MREHVKMIRTSAGWYLVNEKWERLNQGVFPKYLDALIAAREMGEVDLVWITAGDRPTCNPR